MSVSRYSTGAISEHPEIIPIPLRPDYVARVQLPLDLTAAEARKVAAVVLAYAKPGDGQCDKL